MIDPAALIRWRADPVAFVREALVDPETGEPFEMYSEQRHFLREALRVGPDGRLLHPELLFSAPKKSGKTALAAWVLLYVVLVLGGPYAEGYAAANDLEQAQGRVFQAAARMVEASKLLRGEARVTASRIEFPSTGATITALASDYAGAAGSNPSITIFDELWAYTSESAHRLWDELVPVPTRKVSCRLTVTYAGFEGESDLLENLYKRALKGSQIAPDLYQQPGMLCYWTHELRAPWQDERWRMQMRSQLRPNAFLRMIENRWVSGEEAFVDAEQWARCVDPAMRPVVADRNLRVWVGVDASVKRDSTAIVACCWQEELKKVYLVAHKIFVPSASSPIDFERDVESTLSELAERFDVRKILFDPYQMQASAQRLTQRGLPLEEFPQSVPNLTEASSNLYELIKGGNLAVYDDEALNKAIRQTVAVETTRGWRLAKEKTSARIDVVVALAQAALATVRHGQRAVTITPEMFVTDTRESRARAQEAWAARVESRAASWYSLGGSWDSDDEPELPRSPEQQQRDAEYKADMLARHRAGKHLK